MAGDERVMTVKEVAKYLKVHTSTVYRLVQSGKLPGFKIGGDWRFNKESIDQWRMQQEEELQAAVKLRPQASFPEIPMADERVLLDWHGNRKLLLDPASKRVQLLGEVLASVD